VSNGPSGNELGRSVNQSLRMPTPKTPTGGGQMEAEDGWWGNSKTRGLGEQGGRLQHWIVEPNVGRVAHGVPSRVDRLKGLGNAVVPQIPELIARRLKESL